MPEAAPALVEILFLALVFFTIALAFSAKKLVQALLGPLISLLHAIPVIGGALASPIEATYQAVDNACGFIVSKCEALVGASFHVLAKLMDKMWDLTVEQASALLHVAKLVGDHVYSVSGLRALVHGLERAYHGIEHGIKTLTKEYHGIDRRVGKLEHEIGAGIGADVVTQLHALEKDWHRFKTKQLPVIESGVAGIPGDISDAEKWVSDNFVSATKSGVTAALLAALAALGLSGLNCDSNPLKNNQNACGWWGDLADLLGLALTVEAALDFDTLVHTAQGVAGDTTTAIQDVFGLG